jgi:hypothetical protein
MEATDENEELRRFREDWKREVVARKRADTVLSSSSAVPESLANNQTTASESGLQPSITSPSEASYDDQPGYWPSKLGSAVEMYTEAVALEEQGLLDAATQLYRRAFAVDSNVHKAYYPAVESTLKQQAEQKVGDDWAGRIEKPDGAHAHASGAARGKGKELLRVQRDGKRSLDKSHPKMAHLLSNLVLPDEKALSFMPLPRLPASSDAPAPEQPTDPVVLNALTPIRALPDELLVHILLFLIESPTSCHRRHRSNSSAATVPDNEDDDWFAVPRRHTPGMRAACDGATNIERFARVCWKARVLTLDASIWRSVGLCQPASVLKNHFSPSRGDCGVKS